MVGWYQEERGRPDDGWLIDVSRLVPGATKISIPRSHDDLHTWAIRKTTPDENERGFGEDRDQQLKASHGPVIMICVPKESAPLRI